MLKLVFNSLIKLSEFCPGEAAELSDIRRVGRKFKKKKECLRLNKPLLMS